MEKFEGKTNTDYDGSVQPKEVTISERLVSISRNVDELGNTINAIRENLFGANEQEPLKDLPADSAEQMLDSIEERLHVCVKEVAYVSSKL
jgi:hypothetical protein